MNLWTMFRTLLLSIIAASFLWAQDYHWPIRASQSLSATFSEYRSGHLHAGIDIKTWGEMNVACLAVADGYIERIIVSYNGYGRGLFLRLNDGNMAVYGHLELFKPSIEDLVYERQIISDRYSMRLDFEPNQFPVKAGQIIGYSGTSGTEHPHLHFEIRDSLHQVVNPQIIFPGVKDTKAPILDELLFIPTGATSRVNESLLPTIIDLSNSNKPVSTTGPFRIAINAHDVSNGTYNKYNIYYASALLNDSLVFSREFDRVLLQLTDDVDRIYPGIRGKRGWRFMSLFNREDSLPVPFAPDGLNGTISALDLSSLDITVADIKGNQTSEEILVRYESPASWDLKEVDSTYLITRSYGANGFDKIQFYTGNNLYLPASETLYRLNSTTWILDVARGKDGIRALGASGGSIKWIIPPESQNIPTLDYSWISKDDGFVLRLTSEKPYTFPIMANLIKPLDFHPIELRQTAETTAESDVLPLDLRAKCQSIQFLRGSQIELSFDLDPLNTLNPFTSETVRLEKYGVEAKLNNSGTSPVYFRLDTIQVKNDDWIAIGATLEVIETESSAFGGQIIFSNTNTDSSFSIFSPGKKQSWKRLGGADSTGQYHIDIKGAGSFFLIQDGEPPSVRARRNYSTVKRGERLVFDVSDNMGRIPKPNHALSAELDGARFFPDFNPLRNELSFHVSKRLGPGPHIFELTVSDESGNVTHFHQSFNVIR